MKVGPKNRRLGVGLIKTLINPPSFELGLMTRRKRAFLSLTPPNHFDAYSLDKYLHFVNFDMSETCLSVVGHFLIVSQEMRLILLYGLTSLYSQNTRKGMTPFSWRTPDAHLDVHNSKIIGVSK